MYFDLQAGHLGSARRREYNILLFENVSHNADGSSEFASCKATAQKLHSWMSTSARGMLWPKNSAGKTYPVPASRSYGLLSGWPLTHGCISNVTNVTGSVTDWSAQLRLFQTAEKNYGPVDIVYANAGIDEIEDTFSDTFDSTGTLVEPSLIVLDVTLKGAILTAKLALSAFRRNNKAGALVFTGSAASYLDSRGVPVYSAAKHGVLGLARSLRETATIEGRGIRVNLVAPAFVNTAFTTNLLPIWQRLNLPINEPDHVANALLFSGLNPDWHGKGIYLAAGTYTELEQPILDTREQWLGKQNTEWVDRRKNHHIKLGKQDEKP